MGGGYMAAIEKFLGKRVDIPEDRRYISKSGLWTKANEGRIQVGLTQPALVLAGGINDLDWLISEGQAVSAGDTVIFCITGKIMYIDSPLAGTIFFNHRVKDAVSNVAEDPYGKGWLFRVDPVETAEHVLNDFDSPEDYIHSLKRTDGFKNPEGLKGGISEICKAVYSGIRQQKL